VSFDVVFYVTDRGEMPVLDFLNGLSSKEASKCFTYIDMLVEHGNQLPSNFVKHLQDGLWELRPEFGGQEFRLFYFVVLDDSIVMLHAIKKKSQRTPQRDVALALKRMKEVKPNE
jgi:phage-related protein